MVSGVYIHEVQERAPDRVDRICENVPLVVVVFEPRRETRRCLKNVKTRAERIARASDCGTLRVDSNLLNELADGRMRRRLNPILMWSLRLRGLIRGELRA